MNRIEPNNHNQSTAAWVAQTWVSFAVSVGATIVGIAWLPTDPWVRAFLALGLLYAVTSSLSLAKTIRDQHESQRLISRIDASVEKLLSDFDPLVPPVTLFVYGTLMPGHLRWPVLEPYAAEWRAATTPGRLYDLGRGWPVAHFGAQGDGSLVPGVAVDLHPASATACLATTDRVEGVDDGLFVRVAVELDDGRRAWAYGWPSPLDERARIDRWVGPER